MNIGLSAIQFWIQIWVMNGAKSIFVSVACCSVFLWDYQPWINIIQVLMHFDSVFVENIITNMYNMTIVECGTQTAEKGISRALRVKVIP